MAVNVSHAGAVYSSPNYGTLVEVNVQCFGWGPRRRGGLDGELPIPMAGTHAKSWKMFSFNWRVMFLLIVSIGQN